MEKYQSHSVVYFITYLKKYLSEGVFENTDRTHRIFLIFPLVVRGRAKEWFTAYPDEYRTPLGNYFLSLSNNKRFTKLLHT